MLGKNRLRERKTVLRIGAASSTPVLSPPTTILPLPEHSGEAHSLQLPVLSTGAHFLASLCFSFLSDKAEQ